MQRSILAFAIAAAILAMAAPVSTGQRAASSVRPTTAKRTVKPAPSLVQKELQRNLVLADSLRGRLPAGTDLYAAAGGFRRLELFVATVAIAFTAAICLAVASQTVLKKAKA